MDGLRENRAIDTFREHARAPDMSGAGLQGASLQRANLAGAILDSANLAGSDLRGANLRKSILCRASLERADLSGANLGMSDLRLACLEHANLVRVNLNQTNMLGARLAGACIDDVDFAGAILPDGTQYTEETDLERFTDLDHPAFAATLRDVNAIIKDGFAVKEQKSIATARDLSWAEFVERTYGSLADDPIEWHPPVYAENEDKRE